ncbi:MAG: 50S ribosomal protein L15 [Armatimonadetes bacterium]|nr:50S ribosomal protein L15 [Armatimonadota bacterium]MDE2206865.1 50S ribosomal protein L15 [Armatimonadota bacterium]
MAAHTLKPAPGSTHRRKRVGRGIGSGRGKTSTRGYNGNKARGSVNPNFEGGQTPLHRRLPERRGVGKRNPHGFHPIRKRQYALINVGALTTLFSPDDVVTPDVLLQRGLIRNLHQGLKVLADGECSIKLAISAHAVSAAARTKIEAAGGEVTLLPAIRSRA